MFRLLVFCLLLGCALRLPCWHLEQKLSPPRNLKTFRISLIQGFLSMGTQNDRFAWAWGIEDEFIYRRNCAIVKTFLKLWTKLFAIEKMTKILEKGFSAFHEKRLLVDEYKSTVTDLCNHLEKEVNSDSVLSPVYQKMKQDEIARTQSSYSFANFMSMMTYLDSDLEVIAFIVNWSFYAHALMMSDGTKENNYITAKSVVAVAKTGILEEKLQNIYDNARFKVAEMYRNNKNDKNDENQDVPTEKIVTVLVYELEKRISKDNILQNVLEVAKKMIKSSAEIKKFNNSKGLKFFLVA